MPAPRRSPSLHLAPFTQAIPAPIWFRAAHMPSDATYPEHRHDWGEFVYAFSGVIEVELQGSHYLAPPQHGIWLPPRLPHRGLNRQAVHHCSVYIAPELCGELPAAPGAMTVSPLLRALLEHLVQQPVPPRPSLSPAQTRLLQVVLDQIVAAPCSGSYLPGSGDPALSEVLALLQADPGDPRSMAELAHAVHTTERTLARRCRRDLGMPLSEWRQRLKLMRALPLLAQGWKVEAVALELGYAGASAFIAMFRRHMGRTPDQFRSGPAQPASSAPGSALPSSVMSSSSVA